jgi:hypothetical protein
MRCGSAKPFLARYERSSCFNKRQALQAAGLMIKRRSYMPCSHSLPLLPCLVALGLASLSSSHGAGNVQASLQNGNLLIIGDENDNNIMIIRECCQTIAITGRAQTTINGRTGRFDVEGVTQGIDIRMKGGRDFVRFELVPGFGGLPQDLNIDTGDGDDMVELIGLRVKGDTRIDTGDGDDIIFIDGVLNPNGFSKSDFVGRFALLAGSGNDLLEFHHAIFRGEVDVRMGAGIDGVCNTEDSEFVMAELARFDGGPPSGLFGDGFVAPTLEFTHIRDFEDFPDDCSYLGGRD